MVGGLGGGVSEEVSAIAETTALPALVVLLTLAAGAAWWLSRRTHSGERSGLAWFACFASSALIVAVTLLRYGLPTGFDPSGVADWSAEGRRLLARDPLGDGQFLLNVLLFIPAGLSWTWLVRRPAVVLGALGGGALLIELIQGTTGVGAPDVADVVANCIGAAIGVAGAAVAYRTANGPRRPWALSTRIAVLAAVLIVGMVVLAGWFVGASRHQQRVEDELRARFGGTDLATIDHTLEIEPEMVFGALTDYADGTRWSDDMLEIRYPATFFSLRRCVYVAWTASGVDFRKASGRECTEFIDGGR